jgi:hypothetical protein
MQDAVNPIESLDTWTEFVEGKNKARASYGTTKKEGGWEGSLLCLFCTEKSSQEPSDLSVVTGPQLPCWHISRGQTSCCFPDKEAENQDLLDRPLAPAIHKSQGQRGWGWGLTRSS